MNIPDMTSEGEARDAAMEKVADAPDNFYAELFEYALGALCDIPDGGTFTAAELIAGCELKPRERRVLGAIMTNLHRAKLIEPLDRWLCVGSHKRPVRVWRVL